MKGRRVVSKEAEGRVRERGGRREEERGGSGLRRRGGEAERREMEPRGG